MLPSKVHVVNIHSHASIYMLITKIIYIKYTHMTCVKVNYVSAVATLVIISIKCSECDGLLYSYSSVPVLVAQVQR